MTNEAIDEHLAATEEDLVVRESTSSIQRRTEL
jgi:hypothetical protein